MWQPLGKVVLLFFLRGGKVARSAGKQRNRLGTMEDVSKFFQGFGQMPFGEIESTLSPQATIVKQNAPSVEKVTRNGIQKDVYVVIKNSPFVVTLGTTTGTINFNHVAFDCIIPATYP